MIKWNKKKTRILALLSGTVALSSIALGLSFSLTSCGSDHKTEVVVPDKPVEEKYNIAKTSLDDVNNLLQECLQLNSSNQIDTVVNEANVLKVLNLSNMEATVSINNSLTEINFSVTLKADKTIFNANINNAIINQTLRYVIYKANTLTFNIPLNEHAQADALFFTKEELISCFNYIQGVQNEQQYDFLLSNTNNTPYYNALGLSSKSATINFVIGEDDKTSSNITFKTVTLEITLNDKGTFNQYQINQVLSNLPNPYNGYSATFENNNVLKIQNIVTNYSVSK